MVVDILQPHAVNTVLWVDQKTKAGLSGGHTRADTEKEVLGYKDVAIPLGLSCS